MQGIEAVIKAFTKFFYRDVMFALGGSAIILTLLYVFKKVPPAGYPIATYKYMVGAGFSYAIGYAVQDLFTMLGLVRTKAQLRPNALGKFLWGLFEGRSDGPKRFSRIQYEAARHWLYTKAAQRYSDDHERIESLKQVGTVLGPCFGISGMILLLGYFLDEKNCFDLAIAVVSLVFGVVLWSLGWLKVTQEAQHLIRDKKIAESYPGEQP